MGLERFSKWFGSHDDTISEFVWSYWGKAGNLLTCWPRSEAGPPECEEAGVTTRKKLPSFSVNVVPPR
jgi:hypothetical protein